MKIKLNQTWCSPVGTFEAGAEADIEDRYAQPLVDAGLAVTLEPPKPEPKKEEPKPKVEKATAPAPKVEKAVAKKGDK